MTFWNMKYLFYNCLLLLLCCAVSLQFKHLPQSPTTIPTVCDHQYFTESCKNITPSIDLEENSNFCVFDDSLVDVDAEELNVVLSSSGLENVDEEDDNHIEECNETDNNSIKDEDENSD